MLLPCHPVICLAPPADSARSFSSFRNLRTFHLSNSPTLLATIPFRITSFADPYPLTLIESHLYKKHGGAYPPAPLVTLHSSDTPELPQVIYFHGFTHNSRHTGGVPLRLPIRMEQIPRSRVFTGTR
jgi:hypothetical protein